MQLDGPGTFRGRTTLDRAFSHPMFRDLQQGATGFSALVARAPASVSFRVGETGERVVAEMVSGNTFEVLGATPAMGRFFTAADDVVKGGHPVIVLSDVFWQRRFNRSPAVVGQVVVVNATPMTIIGVRPPGFFGVLANEQPAFFVPTTMKPQLTRSATTSTTGSPLAPRRRPTRPGRHPHAGQGRADVRYQQINASELESVPQFAARPRSSRSDSAPRRSTLHDASRGLSQIRGDLRPPVAVLMGWSAWCCSSPAPTSPT